MTRVKNVVPNDEQKELQEALTVNQYLLRSTMDCVLSARIFTLPALYNFGERCCVEITSDIICFCIAR